MKQDLQFMSALKKDFLIILDHSGQLNETMFTYQEITNIVTNNLPLNNNFFLKNIAQSYHCTIVMSIARQLEALIDIWERISLNIRKLDREYFDKEFLFSEYKNSLGESFLKIKNVRNKIFAHIDRIDYKTGLINFSILNNAFENILSSICKLDEIIGTNKYFNKIGREEVMRHYLDNNKAYKIFEQWIK